MGGGREVDSSGPGWGPMAGSREHGVEISGSVKYWGFLGWLSNYSHLKKDSAPWS
jgi:hypothetical protein